MYVHSGGSGDGVKGMSATTNQQKSVTQQQQQQQQHFSQIRMKKFYTAGAEHRAETRAVVVQFNATDSHIIIHYKQQHELNYLVCR